MRLCGRDNRKQFDEINTVRYYVHIVLNKKYEPTKHFINHRG